MSPESLGVIKEILFSMKCFLPYLFRFKQLYFRNHSGPTVYWGKNMFQVLKVLNCGLSNLTELGAQRNTYLVSTTCFAS